jgi:hypothetical protein
MLLRAIVFIAMYVVIAVIAMMFVKELNVSGTTARHTVNKILAVVILIYLLPILAVSSLVRLSLKLFVKKTVC